MATPGVALSRGLVREPRHEGVAKAPGTLLSPERSGGKNISQGRQGYSRGRTEWRSGGGRGRQRVSFYQPGGIPATATQPRSAGLRSVGKNHDRYCSAGFVRWLPGVGFCSVGRSNCTPIYLQDDSCYTDDKEYY
ncbi:MAG TPA: hypothetical protein VFS31_06025 [Chitinophagaceae bacterium]|nr:hypothetical protein [Chitinophagaceae bacterium]